MGNDGGSLPTETPVQSNKQLADAEGDGGVSRDDDGLVSTFGVPAVVDLKLQRKRKLSDASHRPALHLKICIFLIDVHFEIFQHQAVETTRTNDKYRIFQRTFGIAIH